MSSRIQTRAARVLGWIDPKRFKAWAPTPFCDGFRRNEAFLIFVRSQPCMIPRCPRLDITAHHEPPKSNAEEWHDHRAGPLCKYHHQDGPESRHGSGFGSREAFEAFHGIDQNAEHVRLNAAYQAQGGPLF